MTVASVAVQTFGGHFVLPEFECIYVEGNSGFFLYDVHI